MTSKSSQPSARALSMTHSPSPELPKRTPSHHARATPLLDLEPRVTWQRLCGETYISDARTGGSSLSPR